jgi:hypothetical protein
VARDEVASRPGPRQNRVTPFGAIVAAPERGTSFGNRGVLHDESGRVRRAWQVKRWLVCALAFRGRRRPLAAPGRYTALFFLDEATALAAGHRPCFECRRAAFNAFRAAWAAGSGPSTAAEIDARLHAERVGPGGVKRTFTARLDGLPDGTFVTGAALGGRAWLLWRGGMLEWSCGGYRERRPRPQGMTVEVLTPASTVGALRNGYVPAVHASAEPT